ncbi:MAG: hypothetical protein HYY84_06415 [Deltaproteobacteria bacterium]|nr:hypothetical protein [Deltaproteobacteria bacterium]
MGLFDFLKRKSATHAAVLEKPRGMIDARVRCGVLLSCGGGDWAFCVFPMWDVSTPFQAPDLPPGNRVKYVISFNSISDGVLPLSQLMLSSARTLFEHPVYVMDKGKPAEHYPTGTPPQIPPYETMRLPDEASLGSLRITRRSDDLVDCRWTTEAITLRIGQNVGLPQVLQEPQPTVFIGWLREPDDRDAEEVRSDAMGRWVSRLPPPTLMMLLDPVGARTFTYARVLSRIGLKVVLVGYEQP